MKNTNNANGNVMSELKAMRQQAAKRKTELVEQVQSRNKKSYDRPNFWKLSVDASKNGSATIRFLPAAITHGLDEKGKPQKEYVSYSVHNFKIGDGYINVLCRNSHEFSGTKCPICEHNKKLWQLGEAEQNIVRTRKMKTKYFANILVLEDKANPENEGKVFMYEFGNEIFNFIAQKLGIGKDGKRDEDITDDEIVNVFDFWEGCDFKLVATAKKIGKTETYSYGEKSKFLKQSELYGGDETKLAEVLNKCHNLSLLVADDVFPTYEQVLEKMREYYGSEIALLDNVSASPKPKVKRMNLDDDGGEEDYKGRKMSSSSSKSIKNTQEDDDDDNDADVDKFLEDLESEE